MKFLAIDNNYAPIGNDSGPLRWLVIADSALLQNNNPFFIPDFGGDFALFPTLAVKIDRLGKRIAPRFAERYWSEAAIGFNVRSCALIHEMQSQGAPWSSAVSFDGSVILGKFSPIISSPAFSVTIDGKEVFQWSADKLIQPIEEVLAAVSRNNTLKTGDVVLVGAPSLGIPIAVNNRVEARGLDCELLPLAFNIK